MSDTSIEEALLERLKSFGGTPTKPAANAPDVQRLDPATINTIVRVPIRQAFVKTPQYVQVELAVRHLLKRALPVNIAMFGPAGSGKSECAEHLTHELAGVYHAYSCNRLTDQYELFSYEGVTSENGVSITKKLDGFVTSAARRARDEWHSAASEQRVPTLHTCHLEELNFANPGSIGPLAQLLSGSGRLVCKDGEVIERTPNFLFFVSYNEGYAGTQTVNEAMIRSRFRVFEFGYMDSEIEKRIINAAYPSLPADAVDCFLAMTAAVRSAKADAKEDIRFDMCLRTVFDLIECWLSLIGEAGFTDSFDTMLRTFEIVVLPKIGGTARHSKAHGALVQGVRLALSPLYGHKS